MLRRREIDGTHYLAFAELERSLHFTHAITTRQLADDPSDPEAEPLRFAARLGVPRDRLVLLRQVHGSETVVCSDDNAGAAPGARPQADGAILLSSGLFAAIRTADCVPVIAQLPRHRAAALFHSGWRGTCARVVERGLRRLLEQTGAEASELIVAIGPAIRSCCYDVGEEVLRDFERAGHPVRELLDGRRLDLPRSVQLQAREVGASNILDSGLCTVCRNELFYSYRKEKTPLRTWTIAGWSR